MVSCFHSLCLCDKHCTPLWQVWWAPDSLGGLWTRKEAREYLRATESFPGARWTFLHDLSNTRIHTWGFTQTFWSLGQDTSWLQLTEPTKTSMSLTVTMDCYCYVFVTSSAYCSLHKTATSKFTTCPCLYYIWLCSSTFFNL